MKLISPNEFEVEYAAFWKRDIVIIGRGKEAATYHYQKNIPVFCINTSIQFYPDPWYTVMLEAHYKELKDVPLIQNQNILFIKKMEMRSMKLVYGCTPSIFISYMIKHMEPGTTIYLQGFSMDEVSNTTYPSKLRSSLVYNWNRQVDSFLNCKKRADEKRINMVLIDDNSKLPFLNRGIPHKDMVTNG